MRNALLTTALALSLAAPAFAQTPVENARQRVRSVIIFGDEACPPAADPDEIVVCSRRPEEEKYRLPPGARDEAVKNRRNRSWAARASELNTLGKTVNTCTAVGPGGASGCPQEELRRAAEEKRAAAAEREATASDIVATPGTPR